MRLDEANAVVVTLANGGANSAYTPMDASFGVYTFQVLSARLQPGCAESAIDNGLLDLIRSLYFAPYISD
jgi:neutral ceramidase